MIKKTLCFSNPAYLSLRNNQLVIKLPEVLESDLAESLKKQAERTIPIEDVGVVVLDNKRITITAGLLEALLSNNCAVINCDSSNLPIGMLLPLYGNTIQTERFHNQINASLPLKKQLWQQTIRQKIVNQARILDKIANVETKCMYVWANDVKSGDPDNYEARAAVYYWRNLFPAIENFTRERDGIPPNSLLNYGYAILRAVIARALVSSGMLPTLGIHHHNKYNAYCLADDIMEPYRPYVDSVVIDIMDSGIDVTKITTDIKSKLLIIPAMDVNIEGKKTPLMVAASQTTASLYRCFNGESRKLSYPEIKF